MEFYIDNLHKQLYGKHTGFSANVATAASSQIEFGLSDWGELPGQSTWYIRSIKFVTMGYQDALGVAPETRVRTLGGISPRDISSTVRAELDDYQDIDGFPLKDVTSELIVENTPAQNFFRYQKTWKPSEALTLNREQDIVWCVKNVLGNDLSILTMIYVHAERGD